MLSKEDKNPAVPSGTVPKDNSSDAVPSFTAGPWEVWEYRIPGYERRIVVGDQNNLSVCEVTGAGSYNQKVLAYVRANARLLAAAPIFYAAAKAALEYVDNLDENTPGDPNCKECAGGVYFTKGTPAPPMCWIHQLEKALKLTEPSVAEAATSELAEGLEARDEAIMADIEKGSSRVIEDVVANLDSKPVKRKKVA